VSRRATGIRLVSVSASVQSGDLALLVFGERSAHAANEIQPFRSPITMLSLMSVGLSGPGDLNGPARQLGLTVAPAIPARSHSVPLATRKSRMRSGIDRSRTVSGRLLIRTKLPPRQCVQEAPWSREASGRQSGFLTMAMTWRSAG